MTVEIAILGSRQYLIGLYYLALLVILFLFYDTKNTNHPAVPETRGLVTTGWKFITPPPPRCEISTPPRDIFVSFLDNVSHYSNMMS